jgi:hypothetical protein
LHKQLNAYRASTLAAEGVKIAKVVKNEVLNVSDDVATVLHEARAAAAGPPPPPPPPLSVAFVSGGGGGPGGGQ